MTKKSLSLILLLLTTTFSFAQNCDCKSNFAWVKNTFEENDAGFQYALQNKGDQAYADHNSRILEKVQNAKTLAECTPVLYEWLQFFRSGHFAIQLNEQAWPSNEEVTAKQFTEWETYAAENEDFKKYLDNKDTLDFEGIWETTPYKIGIKKVGEEYIGFIIESGAETWTKGQVKLKFSISDLNNQAVFYMRDHSAVASDSIILMGKNHLQIGNINLSRIYPEADDEPKFEQYFKSLKARDPYIEKLNETTLYFRIPSFHHSEKRKIDSIILASRAEILSTENLIIDIRNGTGGSDGSYQEILPFIYTNPIRTVGVEFLSTSLNNKRMLDFINKPEYGFDEDGKKWAKSAYDELEKEIGKFVDLSDDPVSITKYDTSYPFPKQVGIIINQQNGSTDEQFLLAAKQSKKVKLFGTTTYGVLDVSNMYFVTSPCNEFQLGYALSKSKRIPDFTIDQKGIQPDFYLDKNIPLFEWTEFVNEILNE
ncbi:MAG: S41 family peptidase [Bacteroidales bacterium]|jgi:hypothetical protein|nr:S41 family peptidase [Bacteroidales bacterium]